MRPFSSLEIVLIYLDLVFPLPSLDDMKLHRMTDGGHKVVLYFSLSPYEILVFACICCHREVKESQIDITAKLTRIKENSVAHTSYRTYVYRTELNFKATTRRHHESKSERGFSEFKLIKDKSSRTQQLDDRVREGIVVQQASIFTTL